MSHLVKSSGCIWKIYPLVWKQWADESVVFHQSSGNTHYITPTAAKILSLLQMESGTAPEISQRLAKETHLEPDEEILQGVQAALETLDNLGLVQSLPK